MFKEVLLLEVRQLAFDYGKVAILEIGETWIVTVERPDGIPGEV